MQRLRQVYGIWMAGWCLMLLGTLIASRAFAQEEPAMERIRQAFVAGDAHAVLDGAAERVELALPGRTKLYSRAQATYVLEDFFRQHPPERFDLDRTSKVAGSWIASGVYWYRQGEEPFQVYLRLRQKGERWVLREIRIEQRA